MTKRQGYKRNLLPHHKNKVQEGRNHTLVILECRTTEAGVEGRPITAVEVGEAVGQVEEVEVVVVEVGVDGYGVIHHPLLVMLPTLVPTPIRTGGRDRNNKMGLDGTNGSALLNERKERFK